MNKNFNNRVLAASQKIYARLLRAYPPAHREEYGPAMAQLFRDQCRDAWNESRGWGLAKLWLRVLPDWASTSVRERLAALNERRTMNDKLASLSRDRTTPSAAFIRGFVTVFLITVIAATLITFLLPKSYASVAQLYLRNNRDERNSTQGVSCDPYVMQAEVEMVGCDQVLGAAIKKLNLGPEWSKRYAPGRLLSSGEMIKTLRRRVIISQIDRSPVLQIRVYGDNPEEVRSIAMAILESFLSYRAEHYSSDQQKPFNMLVIQFPSPPYLARPNKPINIFIGMVAGGILGLLAGATSALVAAKLGNGEHKNIASS